MLTSSTLEFNENQRAVFCVFSGSGVKQLRHYLNQQKLIQRPTREQSTNEMGDDLWDVDDGGIGLPALVGMEEDGSDDDLR
jgi:F-box and leucine-rich repeat protein GRR1